MKQKILNCRRLTTEILVGFTVVVWTVGISTPPVGADQIDQQIQALQQQNTQTENTISQLQEQAGSYQDAISGLQSQVDQIQQQISVNQGKQATLQNQIRVAQDNLATQKQLLGGLIRTMYVDGSPSTLEELASSKDLSSFVDKQTYREAVQQKVQAIMKQINQLQISLATQITQVDQLLRDEHNQQIQLASAQSQQTQLLSYNQSQQTTYNQQLQSNQAQIAQLRAEQARLIRQYQIGGTQSGDPGHGGYPNVWNDASKDSMLDSWGMYNRECVSYTAFKVHQDYLVGKGKNDMPYWGGMGDAKNWPADARAADIPVDSNPTVGSIAISSAGTWGHAMYVEKTGTLNGLPAIYVSQYNADFTGHYSEGWRYVTGLQFIHF